MSPFAIPSADARYRRRLGLRIVALGLAVLATVLVPYLLIREWSRNALEAEAWVEHTMAVSDTTTELVSHLRDLSSSLYGHFAGLRGTSLAERYASARAAIPPLVDALELQLKDNPEQILRVGRIRTLLEQRLPVLDAAIVQTDPAAIADAMRQVERMLDEGSVSQIAVELAAAEDRLLGERKARATQLRADVEQVQLLSMFAQIILLGAIALISEREARARRAAEHKSSDADLRNRAIFHAVHEPIALLDRDLHILTCNTAFAELYGSPEGPTAPVPLARIGEGAWDDATLQQRLGDVVSRKREIWDYEHRQRTLDGVLRQVQINARQIVLPNASDRAVLLTVSDVTAQKMAELRVLELNRLLETQVAQISEVNRELEAFSYSVSHDLRAPLRHVAGFADKLRRHLDPDAEHDERVRHYLDIITTSAQRMATLIDDLLLYSRLGRSAMRQQRVDLDRLVHEVRDMLAGERSEGIEWRIDPLPTVPGDETMLRQVWQNLLSNAVKYSSTREHAVIEVRHEVDGDMHAFCVRDNGVGFDMAYAGKLFGVFQRLHKASEFSGSGIGLANVRRVIVRHGGRIRAEAELDRGAAFHFTLPMRPVADGTEPSEDTA